MNVAACDGRFRGDLPDRSFRFGCVVIDLVDQLPSNVTGWTLAKQLIRSGTSIGANVAEADHAISEAEFIHRCSIARKEAAETRYWLRLCQAKKLIREEPVALALAEADELVRILATIVRKSQTSVRT
jgi:four helix bundle protein